MEKIHLNIKNKYSTILEYTLYIYTYNYYFNNNNYEMVDSNITIDQVKAMNSPCDSFLVELKDNIYGIRFCGFRIRDTDTKEIFHEFKTDNIFQLDYFASNLLEYEFPSRMLKANNIGTDLNFVVGDKPVKNLDFIERHYIGGKLIKSFEFKFPFFMPNSNNSIEFMYSLPKFEDSVTDKISKGQSIDATSDTFVFVEGKLTIHRRAKYEYIQE